MSDSLQKTTKYFRGSIATTLAGMILGFSLLSLSPEQHSNIHDDAGIVGHTCILTLFSSGSIENGSTDPIEINASLTAAIEFPHLKEELSSADSSLGYLARAPPSPASAH